MSGVALAWWLVFAATRALVLCAAVDTFLRCRDDPGKRLQCACFVTLFAFLMGWLTGDLNPDLLEPCP